MLHRWQMAIRCVLQDNAYSVLGIEIPAYTGPQAVSPVTVHKLS